MKEFPQENELVIDAITAEKNIARVRFSFPNNSPIKKFFRRNEFVCIYTVDISRTPKSLCVVPFLCNILPILWITGTTIEIDELDEDFHNSVEKIKEAYVNMWPSVIWSGGILAKRLIKNIGPKGNPKSVVFFSGGVDATAALIDHLDESPILLSVMGADIGLRNSEKWELNKTSIKKTASNFGLATAFSKSNFRTMVNEPELNKFVPGTSWYQAFQYGIGLSSIAIPLCYCLNVGTILFAGDRNHTNAKSASSPYHEGNLRFAGSKVRRVHNNITRQDKVSKIVRRAEQSSLPISLRVCLKGELEECCACEKCARTILGIIAENKDPADFGFGKFNDNQSRIRHVIEKTALGKDTLLDYYEIQNQMIRNYDFQTDRFGVAWYRKIDFIDRIMQIAVRAERQRALYLTPAT